LKCGALLLLLFCLSVAQPAAAEDVYELMAQFAGTRSETIEVREGVFETFDVVTIALLEGNVDLRVDDNAVFVIFGVIFPLEHFAEHHMGAPIMVEFVVRDDVYFLISCVLIDVQ